MNINYSGQVGGNGGAEFERLMPPGATISNINVYHGQYVDGFEIVYRDRKGNKGSFRQGSIRPNPYRYDLDKGVTITGISGRAGQFVDSIRFHFSDGSKTQLCGGNGGGDYFITVPAKASAVGFYGKSGEYVDSIGIVFKQ